MIMYIELLTHSTCSVIGLSFYLLMFYTIINLQLRANSLSMSNVHGILDFGEFDVIKNHFILNRETYLGKFGRRLGFISVIQVHLFPGTGHLKRFGTLGSFYF